MSEIIGDYPLARPMLRIEATLDPQVILLWGDGGMTFLQDDAHPDRILGGIESKTALQRHVMAARLRTWAATLEKPESGL